MTMSNVENHRLPDDVARSTEECLDELESMRFVARIHEHDATLWRGNQDESRQRLGWLHAPETMTPHCAPLRSFADEVRRDRFTDVVLLGMGGSSLGAEVLNQVIGSAPGYPRLHVVDSTVPGVVADVASGVDLAHTLFIVSSKSGGTLEPNVLYQFFHHEVSRLGGHNAGSQFLAITDAGSSLEQTGRDAVFRQVFLNPADIGGRYSVLSLFGLVPAALTGIDVPSLLESARKMARACGPDTSTRDNPGARLAAYVSACVRLGRDKLTFLTSPTLESFGLWAEQLIAESTGKEGKGIVPVMGEPLLGIDAYENDRAFAYLRLDDDHNEVADLRASALREAGFPCFTLNMPNRNALGGEFYRWEYATAAIGTLLGINPFDQPDVQRAKDASTRVLAHHEEHGVWPEVEAIDSLPGLLATLRPGDYFCILAYLRQRPEMDAVFARLRRHVGEGHRVSTTLGYGPRYLHSTGQLHKGGPNTCVLLQVTSEHPGDVPLPDRRSSFGTVADAQALGDLQALNSLGRRVGRIVLEADDPTLLEAALLRTHAT
jgi:glucose-6-phosphate isomerase